VQNPKEDATMGTRDIVVIGASAGGVQALRQLVTDLPDDLQAAVFIVLHIPPDGPSFLPEILTACGTLEARAALDGEPVMPGRIYVAPPDQHLAIRDHHVRLLKTPKVNRFRPAIDVLFRSVAHQYANRVGGVVLTGVLHDGTRGLKAIKKCGGITVVQDPREAEFPEMPLSVIRNMAVDYCLALSEIASLIVQLSQESAERN
jgi:two-component system, chemotaxis family, protein-glutamate methylesterase/glutaminase